MTRTDAEKAPKDFTHTEEAKRIVEASRARERAEKAVRERWERLGISNPEQYPHVFESDVENLLRWADEQTQAAYRKQIGETGRSVPQYPDQAGE